MSERIRELETERVLGGCDGFLLVAEEAEKDESKRVLLLPWEVRGLVNGLLRAHKTNAKLNRRVGQLERKVRREPSQKAWWRIALDRDFYRGFWLSEKEKNDQLRDQLGRAVEALTLIREAADDTDQDPADLDFIYRTANDYLEDPPAQTLWARITAQRWIHFARYLREQEADLRAKGHEFAADTLLLAQTRLETLRRQKHV